MGRKRQQGVKRTASGRKSRAQEAHTEHMDQIRARMRLFDLTEAQAKDQKAETVIGRLCLLGKVTEDQYLAAQQYLAIREAFKRAVKAPDALRTGVGGGNQGESEKYAAWCQDAVRRYENAQKAIVRHNALEENRGRNLPTGLDYIVCRGELYDHLVSDCVEALDALVHHFGGRKGQPVDKSTPMAA